MLTKNRSIMGLVLGGILLTFLFGKGIVQSIENNLWSVQFARHLMAHAGPLAAAPIQHPWAVIWLARDALERQDPQLAEELVAPLAAAGNKDALVVLADALSSQGEFSEAVVYWEKVGEFKLLIKAADLARNDGRLEDALLAYRAAYQIDQEAGTIPLTSFLWSFCNNQDEAEKVLRDALDSYSHSGQRSSWLLVLGRYLRQQSIWDESEKYLLDLVREVPHNWQAFIELGWVYYQRGDDLEVAMSAFKRVNIIDPTRGEGFLAMGQVYAREKQYQKADEYFVRAIELNPQVWNWWITRANALRESGNLSSALVIYQQALELFPDRAPIYYEMAWAYRLMESKSEAIQAIEQALALSASPFEWYYIRAGQIFEWAGEPDKAIAAYRAAIQINPGNANAQAALKRLAP
ncbi:MAG: tetratricopeptide repeat protein [Anaerolineaceae bacterium]